MSSPETNSTWHFLTSHTQVLLAIQRDPDARLRDVAITVGITERAAQRIVNDLVDAGYVERERVGRRNRYVVNTRRRMRHPEQLEHEIGELLEVLRSEPREPRAAEAASAQPG
jgi:DNA-binding MarR family transcriptional regulator